MKSKHKWTDGVYPNQPITEVARGALRDRLKTVKRNLRLAATKADEDIEHVHQLRVTSRRAVAAIRVYGALLPRSKARLFRKQLRRLRQASGLARDLDVLYERFSTLEDATSDPDCASVLRDIARRRRSTQKPLRRLHKEFSKNRFGARSKRFAKQVRWRGSGAEPTLVEAARLSLPPRIDSFFEVASADLGDAEALHEMRIEGKRLRYTLEVFAGAFGKAARRELLPFFAEVQDHLGEINDHATAITYLNSWLKEANDRLGRSLLKQLVQSEQRLMEVKMLDFRHWWTPKRSRMLRARFCDLLDDGRVGTDHAIAEAS